MSDNRDQRRKQKRQRDQVVAKALRNRDETREKLLAQGRELARRRAENVERDRGREEANSNGTNPSVYSTMPSMDTNEEVAARHSHSTVPKRPKGSTVPAADRLYGLRLYNRVRPDTQKENKTDTQETNATLANPESDASADVTIESPTEAGSGGSP